MNKFIKVIATTSAVATVGLGANAAHAADATATATAEILQQVAITQVAGQDLDFAAIVPDTTNTSVVSVAADLAGTRTCGATTCSGTTQSAKFTVTGAPGVAVDVTLPTNGSTTLTGPGAPMGVNFSASALDMTLGTDVLYVGGDLTVGANQLAGTYNTTFTVTAEYQ